MNEEKKEKLVCINCKHRIKKDDVYCDNCGTKIEKLDTCSVIYEAPKKKKYTFLYSCVY